MTALSANASLTIENDRNKQKTTLTIVTSGIIYQHALVCTNASGTALAAANSTTQRFAGIALECSTRVFPCTGDGTVTVDCYTGLDVLLPITGITAGQQNAAVYAADDATGFDLTTLGPQIGALRPGLGFVSATSGWVRLAAPAMGNAT